MSQTRRTTDSIGNEEWERVLSQLRVDGFAPIESIKVTRAVLGVPLGEAKRIVHESTTWADARAAFEEMHDIAASAAAEL